MIVELILEKLRGGNYSSRNTKLMVLSKPQKSELNQNLEGNYGINLDVEVNLRIKLKRLTLYHPDKLDKRTIIAQPNPISNDLIICTK